MHTVRLSARRRAAGLAAIGLSVLVVTASAAADIWKIQFRAGDQTLAQQALMRVSDFGPGWSKLATKPSLGSGCPGYKPYHPKQSDLVVTGAGASAFTDGLSSVADQVVVLRTKRMVALDWQRSFRDPAAAIGCFRRNLTKSFGALSLSPVRLDSSYPPIGSSSRAYVASVRVGTRAHPVTHAIQILLIAQGRLEISVLTVTTVKNTSAGRDATIRFGRLIAARAKTV